MARNGSMYDYVLRPRFMKNVVKYFKAIKRS